MKTMSTQRGMIKRESTRVELKKRIDKVIAYVEQNINATLDIKDLADTACMSEFHFIRIFSEFCGCTPYQFIIKKRIEKAIKLLRHNAFSVHEISQACGYDSVQTFRKCFKRETGYSPREFYKRLLAVA